MVLAKRHIDGREYTLYDRESDKDEAQRRVEVLLNHHKYVRKTYENGEWRIWVAKDKEGAIAGWNKNKYRKETWINRYNSRELAIRRYDHDSWEVITWGGTDGISVRTLYHVGSKKNALSWAMNYRRTHPNG